jgi:hypothetical protein
MKQVFIRSMHKENVIITSSHKVFEQESNDLALQLRKIIIKVILQ